MVVDTVDNILKHELMFVQWEAQVQKVSNKKGETVEKRIYALYSHTLTLEAAIIELKDMMEWLVTHIFIAHNQWNSHNQLQASLDLESFMAEY